MNIDDSAAPRSCAVKSKYFTEGAAMDDSLSDFQEPKKVNAGPKKTTNPKISKTKKALKRPRGQKDIRTALKSSKKELESYSKTFEKVCKKAGIDIDSEELQLAIALSKSLQNTPSSSNDTGESSHISTTQGRIGKIRTTLQEYGFKVPEVKIAGNTRKLPRKHRKHYKLIHTSDTEKNQIIADKYSQILFQDISHCNLLYSDVDSSNIQIYFLASNVSYDVLKQAEIFYIRNSLIEYTTHNGNLLKDWSTIPGRPESPKLFEPMSINFSEIECSQDELDVVLSGTIEKCRDLVNKKIKDWEHKVGTEDNVKKDTNVNKDQIKSNNSSENLKECNLLTDKKKYRSCSPDMFDEDASDLFESSLKQTLEKSTQSSYVMQKYESRLGDEVMDLTKIVDEKSKQNSNKTKRKSNDLKEITECIPSSCFTVNETLSQLSHKSNVTKRKSNDIMELTECVGNSSPLQNNIDLTQNSDILEENITNKPIQKVNIKTICKNIDENLTKGLKINSHNTEASSTNEHTLNENSTNKDTESMDLTQSSNTSDELPFISLTAKNDKSLDDTIIVDVNTYTYADTNKRITLQTDAEVHIDLTQCAQNDIEICNSTHSKSFFEEFNHDHSESTGEDISCKLSEENPNEVILTQSSGKRVRSRNSLSRKNTLTSIFQCSKEASQIIVETNPLEKYPSTSYRYPKPGKVDLTIIDENCFIVSEHRPIIRGKSPSTRLLKDHSDDDLTKKSDTSEELNEISKDSQSTASKYEDRSNSVLENHDIDIDLTQKSETSEELRQSCNDRSKYDHENYRSKITLPNKSKQHDQDNSNGDVTEDNIIKSCRSPRSCISLGKKFDMSIDYDELTSKDTNLNIEKELVAQEKSNNNKEKISRQSSMLSNCSQNSESEVFDLTDQELNYSLHQSKLEVPKDNFEFGGISIMDDLSNLGTYKKSLEIDHNSTAKHDNDIESIPKVPELNSKMISRCNEISPIKHRRITEIATPQKSSGSNMITVTTPQNSELIIKTNNVTPMKDYESMSTSEIHHELDKYGIKPFKRKRAIQLLTHIYNQTHPVIENADELASPPKRHKPNNYLQSSSKKLISPRKCTGIGVSDSPNNFQGKEKENKANEICLNQRSPPRNVITKDKGKGKGKRSRENQKDPIEDFKRSSDIQNPHNNKENLDEGELRSSQQCKNNEYGPISKDIECNPEDWVFQKREKAKIHSCRVPLHIAFYNYVSLRRDLREAILCYEPVEIDLIHKDLVSYGHRYDPKDLLKFLDKKCITVKTTDNDGRNQKR